jgi:hypothetical protein
LGGSRDQSTSDSSDLASRGLNREAMVEYGMAQRGADRAYHDDLARRQNRGIANHCRLFLTIRAGSSTVSGTDVADCATELPTIAN